MVTFLSLETPRRSLSLSIQSLIYIWPQTTQYPTCNSSFTMFPHMILAPKDCALCISYLLISWSFSYPQDTITLHLYFCLSWTTHIFSYLCSCHGCCSNMLLLFMNVINECYSFCINMLLLFLRSCTNNSYSSVLPLRLLALIYSISITFYWPETNFLSWINLSLSVSANWLQLSAVWIPSAFYPFSDHW